MLPKFYPYCVAYAVLCVVWFVIGLHMFNLSERQFDNSHHRAMVQCASPINAPSRSRTERVIMTAKQTEQTHPMVSKHAELVALYFANTGAKRAIQGRRLNELEVYMDIEGLRAFVSDPNASESVADQVKVALASGDFDYHHFEKPSPIVKQSWDKTPEELLTLIANLRRVVGDESKPEITRSTADRLLTREIANADKRGIKVPDNAEQVTA